MANSAIPVQGGTVTTVITNGTPVPIFLDSGDETFVGKILVQYENAPNKYKAAPATELMEAQASSTFLPRGLTVWLDSAPTNDSGQKSSYDGSTAGFTPDATATQYPVPFCGLCLPFSFNGKARILIGNSSSIPIGVTVSMVRGNPVEYFINQTLAFTVDSVSPPVIGKAIAFVPPFAVGALIDVLIGSGPDPQLTQWAWNDRNGNSVGNGIIANNPIINNREIGVPPYAWDLTVSPDSATDPTAVTQVFGNVRWRCFR